MNTLIELFNHIDNLKKGDEGYSEADILEIGNLHKALPRSEKSWEKLANKIGYLGQPESLRKYINRLAKQQAIVNDCLSQDYSNEILSNSSEYANAYKEKTLIRDIYNSYRLMLRRDARVDSFKESLIDAIKTLEPISIEPCIAQPNVNVGPEAILMLSDLHIGVDCSNFYNTYNYEVAKRRVAKLAADTISYCQTCNVSRLHIVNLGDLIHGLIHTTARIQSEMHVVSQITKAAELLSWLLSELAKNNIHVTYRSCTDNHSRMMAEKSDNIEAENFSKIIDWYLEARLSNTPIEFINDNIDQSIGKFSLQNGKVIMFAHGHLENTNKCIDSFIGATKAFVDYVLLSHFHTTKEKSYNGSKLLVNGSIVGTEDYALSRRLFSPAEQKLLIFDRDNLLDININLQI